MHLQYLGDRLQAGRAHPICPLLVPSNLFDSHTQGLGKFSPAHFQHSAAQSNATTDKNVNGIGRTTTHLTSPAGSAG